MDQEILEDLNENIFWDSNSSYEPWESSSGTAIEYSSYVLSIVTCIIGLPANILVIFVTGFLMKKNKYKIWFLNLALADFTFLLFLPLYAVSVIREEWSFGSSVCKFYNFLTFVTWYAGIYILTALNIDRALSVAKPILHLRFHSRRFCWCMCMAIWVIATLCSIPTILYSDVHKGSVVCSMQFRGFTLLSLMAIPNDTTWSDVQISPTETYPNMSHILDLSERMEFDEGWSENDFALIGVVVPLVVVGYVIPLCVILVSNIIIALHVKNSKMAATSRLYRVVIIAVMSFFCVRTPNVCAHITLLVSIYSMQSTLMEKINSILPLLYSISATNSLLNPMVYVLVGNQVRTKLKNIFTKQRESKSN